MNQFRRGYNRIVFLTGIALLLITLGIEYFQYRHNQHLILLDLRNRLDDHTLNVNLRVRTIQGYVNSLKTAAENTFIYIKRFGITSPLFPYIKNNINNSSYYLDARELKIDTAMIGSLTGMGKVEKLTGDIKTEINMALFLNTFLEGTLKNNKGAVWVYYTSSHCFQNVYPWIPPKLSLYSKSVKEKPYFLAATPQENPQRLNFWTPAYQYDATDGGLDQEGPIVTNSSPVYDGDRFLGSVSLDLSLVELSRILNRFNVSHGSLFLINKDHQVLATQEIDSNLHKKNRLPKLEDFVSPAIREVIKHEMKGLSGWFLFEGSSLIYVKDLHNAPWFMVYVGSNSDLFMEAFRDALLDILVITMILIFVVGAGYFLVVRDFISPAQKLVEHIAKENLGLDSNPQNLPSRWRLWFDIVSRIFGENRALMLDLENRVKLRTKQLQHKNQQLEQTLSDLKKAQDQIIVQEKLASLGALTAGIAHEIKNPLNFIINFSELSLEYVKDLKEKVPDENELFELIEKNMTKTREHAERADSIVKGMLAHARGSTGKMTSFDLNKLIEDMTDLAYIGFQGKETNFSAKIIKDLDPLIGVIEGFEQDLARVFLNIVNNACFAMFEKQKEKGAIYQPEMNIRTRSKEKTVEIIFEDNGPGMSKALLKKIFLPFFTTKDTGKGTGLGLSLSYDIITHQHHGFLTVKSKVGQYSKFIIELPK